MEIPTPFTILRIQEATDRHRIAPANVASQFKNPSLLIIAGIPFPDFFVDAHTDGDPAAHALTDLFLGAADLGDMGTVFPASEEHSNANSMELAKLAVDMARERHVRLKNADMTIHVDSPKLVDYKESMEEALSDIAGARVTVKGKTHEKDPAKNGYIEATSVGLFAVRRTLHIGRRSNGRYAA